MKITRKDTGELITVRKYILNVDTGEESIWSNDWYGRHVIGQDCEFIAEIFNPLQQPKQSPNEILNKLNK